MKIKFVEEKKASNTFRTMNANTVTLLIQRVQATFLTCEIENHERHKMHDNFYTLLGSSSVVMMKGSEMMPRDARKITSDKLITGTNAR